MTNRFVYIEAPNPFTPTPAYPRDVVFLAGGIPDAEPWHDEAVRLLSAAGRPMVVLCPRRRDFPLGDPEAGRAQVRWEHDHLHMAGVVTMFWFAAPSSTATVPPEQVVQPTSLLELGEGVGARRPVVIGADPRYVRRDILENQLTQKPWLTLHDTLEATVAATVALLATDRPRYVPVPVPQADTTDNDDDPTWLLDNGRSVVAFNADGHPMVVMPDGEHESADSAERQGLALIAAAEAARQGAAGGGSRA